jgi:AraC-like DNA-binding protein
MTKAHMKEHDFEMIVAAKCILEKEYYRHYTHEELAQMVGTNERKLRICFREVTSKSLYEYLTGVRINKAKELLENTELPLKVIAKKVGVDKSNLNKSFKKVTSVTPMEWRRMNNNGSYTINF